MDLSFWTGLGWGLASGLAVTLIVVLWPEARAPKPQTPEGAKALAFGHQRREATNG